MSLIRFKHMRPCTHMKESQSLWDFDHWLEGFKHCYLGIELCGFFHYFLLFHFSSASPLPLLPSALHKLPGSPSATTSHNAVVFLRIDQMFFLHSCQKLVTASISRQVRLLENENVCVLRHDVLRSTALRACVRTCPRF